MQMGPCGTCETNSEQACEYSCNSKRNNHFERVSKLLWILVLLQI